MHNRANPTGHRGSSLVLALATILLVGTVLLLVAGSVRNRARFVARESHALEARANAETALAIVRAGAPHLLADDPLLDQRHADGSGWTVRTLSENSRINFQYALRGGDTRRITGQLTNLGVDIGTADIFTSSAADWIDDDDFARLQGAEIDFYQNAGTDPPGNQPMRSIDELHAVRGFADFALMVPDWEQLYTVSSSGRLDVNTAPPRVWIALFGFDEDNAAMLSARPLGPDGLRDTLDDTPYESVDDFLRISGLGMRRAERYRRFLTDSPDTLRVEITAWAGAADSPERQEVVLSALLDLRSSPATVLSRRWISADRRTITSP